jgi:cytosine/adenosine deaminase-related metal-dependent hydrolase
MAFRACFHSVTDMAAQVIGLNDYGIAVGRPANLVVLQAEDAIRSHPPARRTPVRPAPRPRHRTKPVPQQPPAPARAT